MMRQLILALLVVQSAWGWRWSPGKHFRGGSQWNGAHSHHNSRDPWASNDERQYGFDDVTTCPEVTQACSGVPGTLPDKIAEIGRLHDGNGDGQITAFDRIKDMVTHDPNNDGCFTRAEFLTRRAQIGFTEDYSSDYINNIGVDGAQECIFTIAGLLETSTIPLDVFNNQQLQILINMCENNPDLYMTNCDCAQLPTTCLDSQFSHLDECVTFNTTIADREGCTFNPVSAPDQTDMTRNVGFPESSQMSDTMCSLILSGFSNDPHMKKLCSSRP